MCWARGLWNRACNKYQICCHFPQKRQFVFRPVLNFCIQSSLDYFNFWKLLNLYEILEFSIHEILEFTVMTKRENWPCVYWSIASVGGRKTPDINSGLLKPLFKYHTLIYFHSMTAAMRSAICVKSKSFWLSSTGPWDKFWIETFR